ncbi:MAG: HipA domain-containing protein [Kiritimatiellae bacterium]|nr:HipA domain-containing protein [Kiritimatiellia bacterium]
MLRLDFSTSDLNLPVNRDKTRRASISGVQDKVQLKRVRGGFAVVESGGDYILKPVPRNTYAELASDIPANEALTMDIAEKVFHVKTAEHELVEMKDGEYAYLTRRFDRRDGERVQQEDFCQLAGRSPETHGENYKYDASYGELAGLVRRFCPASAVENPKVFFLVLFNYVFANGDAHLKNFSLYRSEQGDYVLTPAYDLLNTAVHFPNEPTATGLDFFADGHFTPSYETLGFYSSADFIELGAAFGVMKAEVREMISLFHAHRDEVAQMIETSRLSDEARSRYIFRFHDRLKAIAQ